MPLTIESIQESLRRALGDAFSTGIQKLGNPRIRKWIIRPGMEFGSPLIWWGDASKTRSDSYGGGPHEGLDFALAQTANSARVQAGLEGLPVIALLDGTALWRFEDLVGDTLIVASNLSHQGYRFILQYSHIDCSAIQIGNAISQGDTLGKIKLSSNPKSITAAHLHISTALIEEDLLELPDDSLSFTDWLEWDHPGKLIYVDPLALVSPEVKCERFLTGDAARSPISRLVSTGDCKDDRLQLRRVLARNFPGIQSLGAKSKADAEALLQSKCLLITCQSESWKIEYTNTLSIPEHVKLSGHGFSKLVETTSQIEQANS